MPATQTFPHEDHLAHTWRRAYEAREADPSGPGVLEAEDAAYDEMVDAIHERGHDIDNCACLSCRYYRATTEIED